MDSFKRIILDNVRYIISVLLMAVIIVILVRCTGAKEQEEPAPEDGQDVVAVDEEGAGGAAADGQAAPAEEPNNLEQDAYPAVNELIQKYFTARADGDLDTLRSTVDVLTDDEASQVTQMAEHIESYNNITCYTKRGPAENSYAVYVCYDIKFQNVDTMAPSLNMVYVCTNADGSLYVANGELDTQTESALTELNSGEDVQALAAQVEASYNEALASDEKLSALAQTITSAGTSQEGTGDDGQAAEGGEAQEGTGASGETVYALETVNVRSAADENSDRVGQIARGDHAVRLADENGWSRIQYNGGEAYVKSEYLTTNQEEVTAAAQGGAPSSGTAHIIETARMRAGEDTGSELIETLFPGTEVTVEENLSSGRSRITYNGQTGYVNTECLGE